MKKPFVKWITLSMKQEEIEELSTEQEHNLKETVAEEASKALEDMFQGLPVSLKMTNLPRDR